MTCEEFEIAIERRERGAPAEPGLAEHLAGCESCRGFETLVQLTAASLARHAQNESGGSDMDRLKETVDRIARRYDRSLIAAALLATVAFLVLWRLNHALSRGPIDWALPLVIVVGSHLWSIPFLGARRAIAAREARRLISIREELLQFCRQDVERRLSLERSARWVLPFAGIAVVINIIVMREPANAALLTAAAALACALCVLRGLWAFRKVHELRRELAGLA